jgi:hypothetical membrane protein
MLGVSSRRALVFWGALYIIAGAVSVLVGILFEDDLAYAVGFAVLFVVLGAGHLLAVRWIDRNGTWDQAG